MKGKLIMTVEQAADRVAWERVRNGGIGGSDIACIMGLNPWKSAFAGCSSLARLTVIATF